LSKAAASVLMVIRDSGGGSQAGDVVHLRYIEAFLRERFAVVETLRLRPAGKVSRVLSMLGGLWPSEMTGYVNAANRKRLVEALSQQAYDYVYLLHECLFPYSAEVRQTGAHCVLFAMNSPSSLCATDPSPLQRALAPLPFAFERRYFVAPNATLLPVSRADARWLRSHGFPGQHFPIAPPGALPPKLLRAEARISRELVVTGSYDWWRKRRDLRAFAKDSPDLPIIVNDALAQRLLGPRAVLTDAKDVDWAGALRFGVITDRFTAGFKLKSLEYVANNCVILSLTDIRADYEGLPYWETFVRVVSGASGLQRAIDEICAEPEPVLLEQFRQFQAACTFRFEWQRCLVPFAPPFTPQPDFDDAP
jgi:hypothetical protein